MKIDAGEAKIMSFNPAKTLDFLPEFNLGDLKIVEVEETRPSSDLEAPTINEQTNESVDKTTKL